MPLHLPVSPEKAAEKAADILDKAAELRAFPEEWAALVAVADGWTRLHTALANTPKTIEPTPTVHIEGLPVIDGKQILDAYRAHIGLAPKPEPALTLPYDERRLPTVTVYSTRYEVHGWSFESGGDAHDAILHLRKID